jgi:acetolactate synthase-1/2/3 large subunit
MSQPRPCPVADLLVRRLRDHGVRLVFGYPGGQITPIYDALYREPTIRHVLARHEQAAAFMADGYARATGRPGVTLAVCGVGVLNAATPLLTAYSDSVPLLMLSGQVPRAPQPTRSGYYHENDQLHAVATFTKWRGRADEPAQVLPLLDQAWAALTSGRPGPVFLEVPVNVLRIEVDVKTWPDVPPAEPPRAPSPTDVEALARVVGGWQRPLLVAGGGVVAAGAEELLLRLADRLGAPVIHTANGKCALPATHPRAAGFSWRRATSDLSNMGDNFCPLFARADGLLALGCRFTQLLTGSWSLRPPPLAQVDIDPEEIGRHYPVEVGVCADVGTTLRALLDTLPAGPRPPWAPRAEWGQPWRLPGLDAVAALRRALPADGILAADVTRLAYILLADFPLDRPRTFLHPAGSVAMGYALPAALGAKAAFPQRKVLAVVGDGGFLMSALELASAIQEKLPVVVLLINDSALSLIKSTQQRRYAERYIAVDLRNPDFATLARSFGAAYERADDDTALETALRRSFDREETGVVEVRPS